MDFHVTPVTNEHQVYLVVNVRECVPPRIKSPPTDDVMNLLAATTTQLAQPTVTSEHIFTKCLGVRRNFLIAPTWF